MSHRPGKGCTSSSAYPLTRARKLPASVSCWFPGPATASHRQLGGWWCVVVSSLSRAQVWATSWIVARQTPVSMDFPVTNTAEGCHFLLWGNLQGLNLGLLHWQADSLSHQGTPGGLKRHHLFPLTLEARSLKAGCRQACASSEAPSGRPLQSLASLFLCVLPLIKTPVF